MYARNTYCALRKRKHVRDELSRYRLSRSRQEARRDADRWSMRRDAIHILLRLPGRAVSGSINTRHNRDMEIRVTLQLSRFISTGRILN